MPPPYEPYRATVAPEWIDYNGHMNVAYHVLAFDRATDRLLDYLGLGEAYRQAAHHSVFALEAHVTYERELRAGDRFRVDSRIVDLDRKCLHLFHILSKDTGDELSATMEAMALHVDLAGPCAGPMPDEALARAEALRVADSRLPVPAQLGRKIGIRRRVEK